MLFVDDPRRSQIEPMHEMMVIWANYWRDKPHLHVSPTYTAMCAVRDWSKRVEEIRESIVLGKPIRVTRTDEAIIAEKMRKLIHKDDAWQGHRRERDILVTYYLKVHPHMPIGRIARMMDCKPWEINALVKNALYFLSTIFGEKI